MALLSNQYYTCYFFKRNPNSDDKTNIPIVFRAEIISEKDISRSSILTNSFQKEYRLVLRTDSKDIYDFREKDKGDAIYGWVRFQGDDFICESMQIDSNVPNSLQARRFSRAHNEKNAVKILRLI